MNELDILIDSPIGAVLFVSGTISVFTMLAILIMKKGTETHNVLGYLFFFGVGFVNYSSAMSYYDGLIPLASIIVSVPVTTTLLILGIAFILPKEKSEFRIKVHVVCMLVATSAFVFGIITQWYHFKISLIDVLSVSDLRAILVLSLPLFLIGLLTILHFLASSHRIVLRYSRVITDEEIVIKKNVQNSELKVLDISSRQNSRIIYKEEKESSKEPHTHRS